MNKQEAMNIISQACSMVKATIQEHQMIQQAIKYLSLLEEKKIEAKEETKKEEKNEGKTI